MAAASLWIGIYLALILAPMLVLLLGQMPPGVDFWWDLAMGLGFAGMAMMGVQFALTARFKRASAPFGIDIIYFFHTYMAIIAFGVVFTHFFILWLLYPDALGALDPREAPWYMTLGRAALVLFLLAVVTSWWRKRLRFRYDWWRLSHVLLATFGFLAAVGHILGVGYYTEAPLKRVLWLAFTLFWVLLVVHVRLVKPWRQIRRPWRVAEVRPERGKSWSLAVEPDGHPGIASFAPGQFAWLTLRTSPFGLREHPFSITSSPGQLPRLEFTIKELGDFTSTIGTVEPGEPAWLDGPYGVFSVDHYREAPGFAFIVGGIGIAPVIGMLKSLAERGDRRPLWLFYGNRVWDRVVRREEIEALAGRLDLTVVHVLQEPHQGWEGESGFVTDEVLERHLPAGRAGLEYFICGPVPMIRAVEEALRGDGVPMRQIHSEIFDLA
jgi:predicted ferric reductase